MMAAPIASTSTTLEPGTPVALFQTRIVGGGVENGQGPQYDVARDGRFLINTVLDEAASPITLLQHWKPDRSHLDDIVVDIGEGGKSVGIEILDAQDT